MYSDLKSRALSYITTLNEPQDKLIDLNDHK